MTANEEYFAEDAVRTLLRHIGENPDRDGLKDTPKRVANAWLEMCSGYKEDPQIHLNTVFEQKDCDQMIVVRDIDFVSHCEHHMVPFHGKAHIGYIPKAGKVVGLSKLARVVDGYSRRLQIQERLTAQIASAIRNKLEPLGVGVILQAEHSCMCIRGVRKSGSSTITTSLHGAMKDEPSCRAEFLNMVK